MAGSVTDWSWMWGEVVGGLRLSLWKESANQMMRLRGGFSVGIYPASQEFWIDAEQAPSSPCTARPCTPALPPKTQACTIIRLDVSS